MPDTNWGFFTTKSKWIILEFSGIKVETDFDFDVKLPLDDENQLIHLNSRYCLCVFILNYKNMRIEVVFCKKIIFKKGRMQMGIRFYLFEISLYIYPMNTIKEKHMKKI